MSEVTRAAAARTEYEQKRPKPTRWQSLISELLSGVQDGAFRMLLIAGAIAIASLAVLMYAGANEDRNLRELGEASFYSSIAMGFAAFLLWCADFKLIRYYDVQSSPTAVEIGKYCSAGLLAALGCLMWWKIITDISAKASS